MKDLAPMPFLIFLIYLFIIHFDLFKIATINGELDENFRHHENKL